MIPRVQFGPEAVAELSEAVRWYEERRDGLGLSFLAAVEEAVDGIRRWPQSGSSVPEIEGIDVRRARLHRFPYHVAYIVARGELRVLAIAHDRRRPGYWRDRGSGE